MKNFHFRAITIVIGLYFTGTMTTPSRKSSMVFNSEYQWNEFLLTNGSTGKHELPMDILQAAATVDISFSFYRVLLQFHMNKEEWKMGHLDLSNSLTWKITGSPLTHLHALEILNLSNNAIRSISLDPPSPPSTRVKHHRRSFRNGLSFLKVLILQRNILSDTPKGLWKLKSLQSLDLSFNEILQIGPSDFRNCLQLENLYLKSNRIFKISPEAFKDLKKLQVVDLSSNALTTILPMRTIALHFPHLEIDLADNQWQCDGSMAVFQTFISESWRKKWNVICNKSVGNEKAYLEIPKSRISREIHLPRLNMNQRKSDAERAGGGVHTRLSTLGKEAHVGSDHREMQGQLPQGVRNARDVPAARKQEDDSQDLALAVCLSVFITFIVAFCLGAFTRPYIDRLWQQRCQNKSPGSDNAYSNQGFYDEVEGVGRIHHPRTDLRQAFHGPNLCENQGPFLVAEPRSRAAVITDRTLGSNRKEPGSWQSSEQGGDNTGAGSGNENTLPNGAMAHFALYRPPNADNNEVVSAAQDHIYSNDILRELNYETVAQESSPRERSIGVCTAAGIFPPLSGSTHSHLNEFDPSLSGEVTASESKMLVHPNIQQIGTSKEIGSPEQLPLETVGSQVAFSKEMQVGNFMSLLGTQRPRLQGANAEEEPSAIYSEVPRSDPGDADPPALLPRWSSGLTVTPANEAVQKDAPSDTRCDVGSDCDSDEGSLFTLSSEDSEDTRSVTEGEACGESSENPGLPKDNVTTVESLEDHVTFQKTLGKYETQDNHFGKPLIPGPDSGLYKTHLESASNTTKSESPFTQPRPPGNSPSSDEIPGMFLHDNDIDPQSQTVEWQCSLKDLEFFNVDSLPQTPYSAEVPSDTEERTWP